MSIKAIAMKIGMDYDAVIEDFCGDVTLIADKLRTFAQDCAFPSLEKAVKDNDLDAITKGARKVRKAAEKIGILPLQSAAEALEKAQGDSIHPLFEDVKTSYQNVLDAIDEYLEK